MHSKRKTKNLVSLAAVSSVMEKTTTATTINTQKSFALLKHKTGRLFLVLLLFYLYSYSYSACLTFQNEVLKFKNFFIVVVVVVGVQQISCSSCSWFVCIRRAYRARESEIERENGRAFLNQPGKKATKLTVHRFIPSIRPMQTIFECFCV